ncbi:dimethylamine monooxygenase subunit DmmA family protein [Streptomyces phaeochromogenes]|uniref:dimethylamine monooxygenase subunit DmmA family protein n=1 Tax=Streptomyces phaeochromogenes TaxID=1923 RepID=UPI002DD98E04|nr:dimethylamine monooxygenase subunit DmmA family protein [Streptomyces phaeochromogenes]WRZ34633.1 hypothetical protein OG931_46315 [Streptomyces phaeochromogenes]
MSVGDQSRGIARDWVRNVEKSGVATVAQHWPEAGHAAVEALVQEMRSATVGWRLMLAGPEADVLILQAAALREGAVRTEIRTHATDRQERRTLCTHCGHITRSRTALGATHPCGGCARTLVVYHHVSRWHAAYMGYMADAEEAS